MLITVKNTDVKVTVAFKDWTKCKYNLGRIFFVIDSAVMFFPVGFSSPILFCCFFLAEAEQFLGSDCRWSSYTSPHVIAGKAGSSTHPSCLDRGRAWIHKTFGQEGS